MQVICISRGSFSGGKELAERLAAKLGYNCLSREELVDAATAEGIHVGKLEMAMMKPWTFNERIAIEREHYLAFTTAYLCDQAMEGKLVYHGRTGHLLLPGVSHVLRIRAVADREYRIKAAMQRLGVNREKAQKYLRDVEEDIRRWVQSMYGISWDDSSHYDMIVNLEQMSAENAAAALVSVAQLPNFQMTPASKQAMEDLRLGAKSRVLLAKDERTARSSFKVRAAKGIVTVTYSPHDARTAGAIPLVLSSLDGVLEVRATMATTNILWVQEEFDFASNAFDHVVQIATKWNAAVELMRFKPENGDDAKASGSETSPSNQAAIAAVQREYNGGIEDDIVEEINCEDGNLKKTLEELARIGRSGGGRVICGAPDRLVSSIDRTIPYSLVVVGNIFMSKGEATRKRLGRELMSLLGDNIKAPVVAVEELKAQYLFGMRDVVRMFLFMVLVFFLYFTVFRHQVPILRFLAGEGWEAKSLAAAAVFIFVPAVAYLYGTVTKSFLKLIRME